MSAWRASTARAGSFMALRVAKSCYSNLNLGLLVSERADTEAELEVVVDERAVQTSDLAYFTLWDEFVPERVAEGDTVGVLGMGVPRSTCLWPRDGPLH